MTNAQRKVRAYEELKWARVCYLEVTDGKRDSFVKVSKKELSLLIYQGFQFEIERVTKIAHIEFRYSFFRIVEVDDE
jgi:hypothetical protein